LIWFDLIWFDLIWFDLIWFDLIWFDLIWFKKKKKNRRLRNNFLQGTIPTLLSAMGLNRLELLGSNKFCPVVDFSTWAKINDYAASSTTCILPEDKLTLIDFYNDLESKGTLNWNLEDLCSQPQVDCFQGKVTHLYPFKSMSRSTRTFNSKKKKKKIFTIRDVDAKSLSGTIPLSLFNLTELQFLLLSFLPLPFFFFGNY